MTAKTLRENLCNHQGYMPCPCLKRENHSETLCINGDEVHDINFVDFGFIPTFVCSDKASNDSLCLNMVFADNEGFIRCGTSKRLIKVRNCHIPIKDYLNAIDKIKELYNGDLIKVNSCPECLYKTIISRIEFQEKQDAEEKSMLTQLAIADITKDAIVLPESFLEEFKKENSSNSSKVVMIYSNQSRSIHLFALEKEIDWVLKVTIEFFPPLRSSNLTKLLAILRDHFDRIVFSTGICNHEESSSCLWEGYTTNLTLPDLSEVKRELATVPELKRIELSLSKCSSSSS